MWELPYQTDFFLNWRLSWQFCSRWIEEDRSTSTTSNAMNSLDIVTVHRWESSLLLERSSIKSRHCKLQIGMINRQTFNSFLRVLWIDFLSSSLPVVLQQSDMTINSLKRVCSRAISCRSWPAWKQFLLACSNSFEDSFAIYLNLWPSKLEWMYKRCNAPDCTSPYSTTKNPLLLPYPSHALCLEADGKQW